LANVRRRRRNFISPGPDYVWSIDGYLKLQEYGIEIYAAIDTYSRKIMWTYVGNTARTAVSVAFQYLQVVKKNRIIPQVIRTDRGGETVLLAGMQYLFSRTIRGEDLLLKECYAYGTSTANERIEAWWNQLCKGQTMNWRVNLPLTKCQRAMLNLNLDLLCMAEIRETLCL
jgi:hypothetical protein